MENETLEGLKNVIKLLNDELDKETKYNILLSEQLNRKNKACLTLTKYISTLVNDYIELENKLAECMKENEKLKKVTK